MSKQTTNMPASSPKPRQKMSLNERLSKVVDPETWEKLGDEGESFSFEEIEKTMEGKWDAIEAIFDELDRAPSRRVANMPKGYTALQVYRHMATQATFEGAMAAVRKVAVDGGDDHNYADVELVDEGSDYPSFMYIHAENKDPLKGKEAKYPGLLIEEVEVVTKSVKEGQDDDKSYQVRE